MILDGNKVALSLSKFYRCSLCISLSVLLLHGSFAHWHGIKSYSMNGKCNDNSGPIFRKFS